LPTTTGVYSSSAKGLHITVEKIYIPMKKNVEHKIPIKKGEPGYRTGRASIGNFTKKTQLDTQWVHSKAVQFNVS